jgi:hypothetical protein
VPQPVAWQRRGRLTTLLAIPLALAACLSYVLLFFYPVAASALNQRDAHRHAQAWLEKSESKVRAELNKEKDLARRLDAVERANLFLDKYIIKPLERAVVEDPFDARPKVELAQWYGNQCELFYRVWQNADRRDRSSALYQRARQLPFNMGVRGIERASGEKGPARKAEELDPDGAAGYLAEYRLRMLFAQIYQTLREHDPNDKRFPDRRKEELRAALEVMTQLVERDPTEVQYYYLLADTFLQMGDPASCRKAAKQALTLDDQAADPRRRLSDPQREQIRTWINLPSPT